MKEFRVLKELSIFKCLMTESKLDLEGDEDRRSVELIYTEPRVINRLEVLIHHREEADGYLNKYTNQVGINSLQYGGC